MDNKDLLHIDSLEFCKIKEEFYSINENPLIYSAISSRSEKYSNTFDKPDQHNLKKRKRFNKFILIPIIIFLLTIIYIEDSVKTITSQEVLQYVVRSGDTLWDISSRYLGSSLRYLKIVEENNIPNPDLIYPNDIYQITIEKTTKYKNGVIIGETTY